MVILGTGVLSNTHTSVQILCVVSGNQADL